MFGKGINLNNWLEAHWDEQDYPIPSKYNRVDFEKFAEAGFNSVRIPIAIERLSLSIPPYTTDFEHNAFKELNKIIKLCKEFKLKLIIDNHQGFTLNDSNFLTNLERLSSIWLQVIDYYYHLDYDNFFFELYNEPTNQISIDNWTLINSYLIDKIRKLDRERYIITGSTNWNSGFDLIKSGTYDSNNILYTFHCYEPFKFTHQGFDWLNISKGKQFPTSKYEINIIRKLFKLVRRWSDINNVYVFLGEIGVSRYADAISRNNWIKLISDLMDEYNFDWFYWDWKRDFGFVNYDNNSDDNFQYYNKCFIDSLKLNPIYSEKFMNYPLKINFLYDNNFEFINIEFNQDIDLIIEFYNNNQLIQTSNCQSNDKVDVSNLENGLYNIKIIADEMLIKSESIKIER